MIHFCVFGAHEGILAPDKVVYFTMFGGCELKQPTLAKRLLEARRYENMGMPIRRRNFFVTIFGGTSIKVPTLAEEFLDLQDALRAKLIAFEDWDAAVVHLNDNPGFGSLTAFGGFEGAELPSEDEEVEGLALNRHIGNISEPAGRTLELAVGRGGSHRTAILRQALAAQSTAVRA